MKRKGISLMILIVSIVTILIIASVIIINMVNTNVIDNSKAAVFKSDVANMKDELSMYIADEYTGSYGEYEAQRLQATEEGIWYGSTQQDGNITDIITSMDEKYVDKLFIQDGKLVANKMTITVEEEKWLNELGINSTYQTDIGKLNITPSTADWTNGNVAVTLSYANIPTGYVMQYKIGTGAWTNYSSALTISSNNTTVAARLYNASANDEVAVSSKAIANIDKAAPTVGTLSYSATNCTTVNLVLASATDDLSKISKIVWYYKTASQSSYSSTTTTYSTAVSSITANTSKAITVTFNTDYTVYAEVYDVVGNKATTNSITAKGNTTHNATTGGSLKSAATCTSAAVYYHKCSRCSTQLTTTYTSGNANGHTSVNGGTSGVHTKCSVCGVTTSTAHSYTSSVQTAATCTTKGTTKYTCSCGYYYTSQNIATVAHNYSSKTVNSTYLRSSATCTAAATYYYKCSGCSAKGTTYYSSGSALGHYDSNPNYAYNATYHIYGYCDRCNCEMINSTTAGNAKHTYSSKTVNASYLRSNATCTAAATYYYKCTGCASKGSTYYSSGSALGHNMTKYTMYYSSNNAYYMYMNACSRCNSLDTTKYTNTTNYGKFVVCSCKQTYFYHQFTSYNGSTATAKIGCSACGKSGTYTFRK